MNMMEYGDAGRNRWKDAKIRMVKPKVSQWNQQQETES